jgi:hypothetical protein
MVRPLLGWVTVEPVREHGLAQLVGRQVGERGAVARDAPGWGQAIDEGIDVAVVEIGQLGGEQAALVTVVPDEQLASRAAPGGERGP